MGSDSPREAMLIGKKVKVTPEWTETEGLQIMNVALQSKLDQVPTFKTLLMNNKGKSFLEYTRHSLWGIG